ncbi:ABC-F family ATP-binding cassette domain-containing protein [Ravibacter arvi]|uniref:ABC-F family ATP-binding cassette domain-containing protein n=1 Tax=Ravibacter arvi TaxID=2051041 RepID=A0ABP8LQU7_9BACT
MIILQNITYTYPGGDQLFHDLSLVVEKQKMALVGQNGTGKSTLLKIIAGELSPSAGVVSLSGPVFVVPQIFGQLDHLTVAQALGIAPKLNALKEILNGLVTEENLSRLDGDWEIEERCSTALHNWELADTTLERNLGTLSGGQKTRVFLAGIDIHQTGIVLLDEPTNHLDTHARKKLYAFIESTSKTVLTVSHDRRLLNLHDTIGELSKNGLALYGGNYDFYVKAKEIENDALEQDIKNQVRELRKAREKERETMERQQKLDNRGKKKQEKAGVARIMMNTLRNKAENSTAKLKGDHAEKTAGISKRLHELRSSRTDPDQMKLGLASASLHQGKILFEATAVNYRFAGKKLWPQAVDFRLESGARVALLGSNGSGKTTLIKTLLGLSVPDEGKVFRADVQSVYVDQDYSLLNNQMTIYEQAQLFNTSALREHEVKTRLNRFLFTKEDWEKRCGVLSGGERMRLTLCCLGIQSHTPDLIVLDEPTNNLDIRNIEILSNAIAAYSGTLVVVSHDASFLEEIGIDRELSLKIH